MFHHNDEITSISINETPTIENTQSEKEAIFDLSEFDIDNCMKFMECFISNINIGEMTFIMKMKYLEK